MTHEEQYLLISHFSNGQEQNLSLLQLTIPTVYLELISNIVNNSYETDNF